MASMNIGDAAAAAGVTPKMIRHYESLGLLPEAERTDAGYRLYTEREVGMLRFIRQARALGFPIPQIDELLALWRDDHRQSREVVTVARRQLAELEERERELHDMRMTLSAMVDACPNDHGPHCAILQQLAGPAAAGPAHAPRANGALKQVKAGARAPKSPRARRAPAPEPATKGGHSGLVAWSRSFAGG